MLRFTNLDVALPFLQPHELPQAVRGTIGAPEQSGVMELNCWVRGAAKSAAVLH